jgi:hypothetical protein
MSIVRVRRQSSFTVIPNEIINDDALDGATLGLLVYLLSKPKDWCISIKSIAGLKRFGSHGKVVEGLKLLRALGYAQLQKFRDGSTDWIITDEKGRFDPDSENRNKAHQPDSENRNKANQGNDTPGTPDLMPDSENRNKAGTPDLMPDSENRNALKRTDKKNKELSKSTRANKTPIPDDFAISDKVREWYAKQAYTESLEQHFEHFCDKARQNGYVYADWDAALRNAIRSDWAGLRKPRLDTPYQQRASPPTRHFPAEPKSRARDFLA